MNAPLLALVAALTRSAAAPGPPYDAVVARVASMVSDPEARRLAAAHGLDLLDLTWEDTGRWQGSSVGPNISDLTIEVVSQDAGRRKLALMPVLRSPNFTDRTADVPLDRVYLRVGNERRHGGVEVVSLRDVLAEPARFLSSPNDGRVAGGSLLAPRDTHALVSAQAAFLPVPRRGEATFHPVVFNYQSTAGSPAVLTLLVTRQGTSMTVVDNARDTVSGAASWGQRLFFNEGGERAALTAERLSDVEEKGVTTNGEAASSLGADANLLLLVQVPLKHRAAPRQAYAPAPTWAPCESVKKKAERGAGSDMEAAVLGHGDLEGPFTELAGLTVERDPRFPVRVTVQFYQAVTGPQRTAAEMAHLASLVDGVYRHADAVGSLVVPGPGDRARPTSWDGASPPPGPVSWWDFPGLVERWRRHARAAPDGIGVR